MKPSPWKFLLSHVAEVPLEKASTRLNPSLSLSLRNGRYYLTTPNAVYSFGEFYRNFRQTFKRIHVETLDIEEVLVLGFGMGSIPWMLEKTFKKNCRYQGIEADGIIMDWAKSYLLPELSSPIELFQTDAFGFVHSCKRKFDLIAVDLFLDDLVPVQFDQADFWKGIKSLLKEDGIVLHNRLVDTDEYLLRTETFLETTFMGVFPTATHLDLGVNWMLMNKTI